MARTTVVTMIDDLDDSITDDVLTCYLALGDTAVEIDLGTENREELEAFLDKFIKAGRPVRQSKSGRPVQSKPARKVVDRDRTHEIRQWAKDNGLNVSERGRISKEVTEAYEAAH